MLFEYNSDVRNISTIDLKTFTPLDTFIPIDRPHGHILSAYILNVTYIKTLHLQSGWCQLPPDYTALEDRKKAHRVENGEVCLCIEKSRIVLPLAQHALRRAVRTGEFGRLHAEVCKRVFLSLPRQQALTTVTFKSPSSCYPLPAVIHC